MLKKSTWGQIIERRRAANINENRGPRTVVASTVSEILSITGKLKLWAAVLTLVQLMGGLANAQSGVRLRHSVSPGAALISNAVAASPTMPMEIVVRLSLRNTEELEQLQRDQRDRSSPSYHQRLTAAQFNARFGPTQAEADAVAQWLGGSGFTVSEIDLPRHSITAQASAAVVSRALDVAIISDGTLFANTTEPIVPSALAPLIANIEGLYNTFAVKPLIAGHVEFGPPLPAKADDAISPDYRTTLGDGFAPSDFRTYYDETPVISGGNSGTEAPDCIGLVEISNVHNSAITAFTQKFRLPAVNLTKVFATSGKNPGYQGNAEIEADLDIEYAHVVAPATPIKLYVGAGANALQDAIRKAVTSDACGVISISFNYCGMPAGFYNGTLDAIFQQAASQKQSVFVGSGDEGAAGLVLGRLKRVKECVTANSFHVSEMSADPNVTSVGGTQFNPLYNSSHEDISTVLDGLESAWNEEDSDFQGATGGGISTVFPRPSWQTGIGVPAGTMRMVPDVALGASGRSPGYYIVAFYGGANRLGLISGTSLSSPSWAGLTRLIAKASNTSRLGPMNPRLYELGNMGSESGLIDVTAGWNGFNGVYGYFANLGPGYDMTTGWGSPAMSTLVVTYPK